MPERTLSSLATFLRALRLLGHLAKGLLTVAVLFPYCRPRERAGLVSQWSLDCLRILNIHVRIRGEQVPQEATAILFVANHVSWLDVLALNAVKPVRFVAKSEVRAWPVIGWLAARTGTLFLQRARPRQLVRLNRSLYAALTRGQCIAIFPEGTTSSGCTVLRFHSGLLESAVKSCSLVWPVAFRYRTADGIPTERAAFVGNQSLLGSLHQIMALPSLHLDLHFLPALQGSRHDRYELARRARMAIVSTLDSGLLWPDGGSHSNGLPVDWSDEPTATT